MNYHRLTWSCTLFKKKLKFDKTTSGGVGVVLSSKQLKFDKTTSSGVGV